MMKTTIADVFGSLNEDSKKPIGVITDRDIRRRTIAEGKNPLDLTVKDAMTPSVETVRENTSVEDCCNLMEYKQIAVLLLLTKMAGVAESSHRRTLR